MALAYTAVITGSRQMKFLVATNFYTTGTGYFSGGINGSRNGGTYYSTTDGLSFATDTTGQVTKGALVTAKCYMAGANSTTLGYFSGGTTQNGGGFDRVATTNGLTFATDTIAQITKGVLTAARDSIAGAFSSTTGYFAGGTNTNGDDVTTTDGLTFSSDTTAQVTKGALVSAISARAGCNSSTIGYFGGGNLTNEVSALTFSSDTTAQVTKAVIVGSRHSLATCNSLQLGYFAGGYNVTPQSNISAIDFSTDTTAQTTKAVLATARWNVVGASSHVAGYFAGGLTSSTITDVTTQVTTLHFALDTTSQFTRGVLTVARGAMGVCQSL